MNSPDTPAPATTTRNFRSAITPRKTRDFRQLYAARPRRDNPATGEGKGCASLRRGAEMPMMNRIPSRIASAFAGIAVALTCASCGHSPPVLVAFRTEQQAQQHCPGDTVVWLDLQNAAYYLKGNESYGRTGTGRYACQGEADAAGIHEMKN